MTSASKFAKAHKQVAKTLQESGKGAFTELDLRTLLSHHRDSWQLATSMRFTKFLEAILEERIVARGVFESENYRPIVRYILPSATPFQLALALRPRGYLTHGTAVFLHALTDQIQNTIYVNTEQSAKGGDGQLTQAGIDRAFSNRQRLSNYIFQHGKSRFVLISGKQTGNLGVTKLVGPKGEQLLATNLERTLIDITVRPAYAGGIFQVLDAFRGAKDKASPPALVKTLERLEYLYPYHQAIGFLMERAGYDSEALETLRDLGLNWDFYLTHSMKQKAYDSRWRVYYPTGM